MAVLFLLLLFLFVRRIEEGTSSKIVFLCRKRCNILRRGAWCNGKSELARTVYRDCTGFSYIFLRSFRRFEKYV